MKKTSLIAAIVAGALFSTLATPAFADDMDSWKKAVVAKLIKSQKYPRAAQVREIEGKAKVRLVVAADGSITAHEIVESTSQDVLDNEIPKLVAKLNPLPSLPAGQGDLSFILPLEWSLR